MNFMIHQNSVGGDNLLSVSQSPVNKSEPTVDVYFSADVETDGSIPGPFSILSFALVYAGSFDGKKFVIAHALNLAIKRRNSAVGLSG